MKLKFMNDAVMLAVFLCVQAGEHFPLGWFHETAGLALVLMAALHLALNWSCIIGMTRRLFKRGAALGKINYFVDFLILVVFVLVIVSGLGISRMFDLSWLGFSESGRAGFRALHVSMAMILLALLGVHLGLHWDWVRARLGRPARGRRPRRAPVYFVLVGLLAGGAFLVGERVGFGRRIGMLFDRGAAASHGPHHQGARPVPLLQDEGGAGRGDADAPVGRLAERGEAVHQSGAGRGHEGPVFLLIILAYCIILAFFTLVGDFLGSSIGPGGRREMSCRE